MTQGAPKANVPRAHRSHNVAQVPSQYNFANLKALRYRMGLGNCPSPMPSEDIILVNKRLKQRKYLAN